MNRDILQAALEGLLAQRAKIDASIREVQALLGQSEPPAPPKHRLSPEGRERIAQAQRRRWAQVRQAA